MGVDEGDLIIIPAHNEEDNIGKLTITVRSFQPEASILVVDDGSTDNTAKIAHPEGVLLRCNPPGSEYGDGFRTGLLAAVGKGHRRVVFMDAGYSHHPVFIAPLLAKLDEGYDMVIGSRLVSGGKSNQSLRRKIFTWLATRLIAALTLSRPMDYSSFRAFTEKALIRIMDERLLDQVWSQRCHAFNPQFLAVLKAHNFRIAEVPIDFRRSKSTRSLQSHLDFLVGLVNIWLLRWFGDPSYA